jgi:basic amino acid/polyamine antiporter, APA family
VPLGDVGIRVAAALAMVVLTIVNALGVRAGKRTNNLLMAVKLGGIVVLAIVAFLARPLPASDFNPAAVVSGDVSLRLLLTALVPILFAYGGWHSCASIAGEIKDPARNLPRANVIGVAVVVAIYLTLNLAYLWVLTPAQIAASPALAADAARVAAGDLGARSVSALILVSSLGFLAVVIMTAPRLYYAMARDGLFFARAGRLSPRFQTPVFALWFQAAVSLVLLTTNSYDQLLSYVVFADWLFFGLTAGALLIVRRRPTPPGARVARVPGHPFTTLAFIAVAAGVVVNSFATYPAQSVIGSTILVVATSAFFLIRRPEPADSV